jgi:carbamoyltransferase
VEETEAVFNRIKKIGNQLQYGATREQMNILGISAFYHDSAACLVQDGKIISAAQEERFTRKKHDFSFPNNALGYCLDAGGLNAGDLDYVAFYDKPFVKFERILETYLAYAPHGVRSFIKALPLWVKQKIWMKEIIARELGFEGKIIFPEHHESHAASAFFPSPFQEAAFLTLDGVGEWTTASYGVGEDNQVRILAEIHFPHSLGLLYSAFTYYTGFKVNSGEYKVMGLAPYGEPRYKDLILSELMDLKEDGSFKMNMTYFNYCSGLTMTNRRFDKLFGGPPRKPESRLTQRDMDLARSVQDVTEEVMLRMTRHIHRKTGQKNLCLAGGVALNCVGNGRILREGPFEHIWIQPAAGDAGGALGAALFVWHQYLGNARVADGARDSQQGSYLGPVFENDYIADFLKNNAIPFTELSDQEIPGKIADLIADQKVIGWFQGRMEFGPRALGNRSIIGDARSQEMQEKMNLKIKFRESFRPFAPSILQEKASDFFEIDVESPYMLLVAPVKKEICREMSPEENERFGLDKLHVVRSSIPAITHVDYSARLQTVDRDSNSLYYRTIEKFEEKYGCPVIINTSFNVRGEPIVCTPEDAYRCFMRTNMDYLMVGNFLLEKKEQKPLDKDINWLKEFELD